MQESIQLLHPEKSHRKQVRLPKDSIEFAEFFGIMMGDGGINNPWQANVTLNSVADAEYSLYVSDLMHKLFDTKPALRKRKDRQAVVVCLSSMNIVDFLVEKGLPRGNKLTQGLRMPEWILSRKAYRVACLRGLVDTDGCLYIHKHTVLGKQYHNIGFCFASHSPELIAQFIGIFEEFGIIPHISNQGRSIYLYQADAIAKYLSIFGSSNSRITSVYEKWRRLIAV